MSYFSSVTRAGELNEKFTTLAYEIFFTKLYYVILWVRKRMCFESMIQHSSISINTELVSHHGIISGKKNVRAGSISHATIWV